MDRRTLLVSGVAGAFAGFGTIAEAQGSSAAKWPAKPIRLIVTFPPGGSSDALARILSKRLGEEFGQPVVVENKAGAGGAIGTAYGAKADADGYSFLVAAGGSLVVKPLLGLQSYDTAKDFAPVAQLITSPFALVINTERLAGVGSVKQLVERAKRTGEPLSFGSAGNGTQQHLAGELLGLLTGVRMNHIPYKGAGPAAIDLIGGSIPVAVLDLASIVPSMGNERIKVLAVSSTQRSTIAPAVPSAAEEGIPDWQASGWIGLLAPAGTPGAIVAKMEHEVNRILREKAVADQILATGNEPAPSTAAAFKGFIASESVRWKQVVQKADIKGD